MSNGRAVEDVDLLEAWGRGERASGAALFERYYPCVARFFHNKVSDAAQEDLIHQTFDRTEWESPRCLADVVEVVVGIHYLPEGSHFLSGPARWRSGCVCAVA